MKRPFNTARIRRNCSYTVQDICGLFGIHKNTVREWFRNGLAKTDQQRPYLIHGNDFKVFLEARQKSRKKKCAPREFYCFRCKIVSRAMGNLVDVTLRNEKTVMLSGFCECCDTPIRKVQSVKALAEIFQNFDIPKQQQAHISESLLPSLNCYLNKEIKR